MSNGNHNIAINCKEFMNEIKALITNVATCERPFRKQTTNARKLVKMPNKHSTATNIANMSHSCVSRFEMDWNFICIYSKTNII